MTPTDPIASGPDLPADTPPLPIPIARFIETARAAADPPSLWSVCLEFYHSRGVRMVSYHHYAGIEGRDRPMIVADGFPEDWVQHYVEDRLYRVDPIPDYAAHATEPFFWSDMAHLTRLLDAEQAYLEELKQARLGEGLGLPVFGPMGRDGYVGLGFGGTRPALQPRQVRELQMAAQLGHLVYCGLVPATLAEGIRLAPREREILHWIARGKSNSVIAEIVGISPHTVDTHVRRLFDKLGVSDRTTAAVKGLGSGLLTAARRSAAA
jgi:LuxR family transcriptional regulator/LuxR family quorum-sensing system transcriptional regulator CciR